MTAQGIILKRQAIARDTSAPGGPPMRPADLRVGDKLSLFGKTLLLTDADAYTRQWCVAANGQRGMGVL